MNNFTKKYYAIAAFFITLGLLAWSSYAEALKVRTVSEPLSKRLEAHLAAIKFNDRSFKGDVSYDLRKVSNSQFFKLIETAKPTRVVAQKTRLKLTLEGIVAADDNGISRAIIKSNNKVISYKIGDEIEGTNAELNAVEGLRVLIDRAGVIESLELNRKKVELTDDERELLIGQGVNNLIEEAQAAENLQQEPSLQPEVDPEFVLEAKRGVEIDRKTIEQAQFESEQKPTGLN